MPPEPAAPEDLPTWLAGLAPSAPELAAEQPPGAPLAARP